MMAFLLILICLLLIPLVVTALRDLLTRMYRS